ncbi:Small HspC2 heat shock protein [hydrothermal vent metagenome]|uniref:Small HspC2 heat shock protein n=1 Tax=hydrothermal vent metagenome TaxID=652676 RepID=A0A3B1DR29_9ZZZZ
MKNKLILSGLALVLVTSLNATSSFLNNDNQYKQFRKEITNFLNDNSFFTFPYKQYRINISNTYPKMDIFENKKQYIFKFELAGINKKDIKVTLTDQNVLTITGSKKSISKKDMIRQEQYYGTFSRSISLPDDINSNKINIKYNNGILKVTINKDIKKNKKNIKVLSIH